MRGGTWAYLCVEISTNSTAVTGQTPTPQPGDYALSTAPAVGSVNSAAEEALLHRTFSICGPAARRRQSKPGGVPVLSLSTPPPATIPQHELFTPSSLLSELLVETETRREKIRSGDNKYSMRFTSSPMRSSPRRLSPRSVFLHNSSSSNDRRVGWTIIVSLTVLAVFLLTNVFLESKLESMDDENLLFSSNPNSNKNTNFIQQQQEQLQDDEEEPTTLSPIEVERIHDILDPLRVPQSLPPTDFAQYDILNCPDTPPAGYPYEWNLVQLLQHWGIDDTDIPPDYLHQGLCVFDWTTDHKKVRTYRQAEVPFVLQNHPDVMQTASRWSTPGYLQDLLGDTVQRNEHAFTNHFMFWRPFPGMAQAKQKPPTDTVELSYAEWLEKATALDLEPGNEPQRERWYFRLNGERHSETNMYLYDELPFFLVHDDDDGNKNKKTSSSSSTPSTLFMVDPLAERGINCRFGMKGIFAESHFDPTRNWVVVLGGQRRYILSHPRECPHLQLHPANHPAGRHSAVNWSDPVDGVRQYPGFAHARANEVVLQAGDALYLPTSWFHAIVSLNTNYQCNARSGMTNENMEHLTNCGFGPMAGAAAQQLGVLRNRRRRHRGIV